MYQLKISSTTNSKVICFNNFIITNHLGPTTTSGKTTIENIKRPKTN
jgi:hypothetical protein